MSLSGSLAFLEAESFYSSTWGGGGGKPMVSAATGAEQSVARRAGFLAINHYMM